MKIILVAIMIFVSSVSFAEERYLFDCKKIDASIKNQYEILEFIDKISLVSENHLNHNLSPEYLRDVSDAKRVALENLFTLEAILRKCNKEK